MDRPPQVDDFGSRQLSRILSGEKFAVRPWPRREPVITVVCPFKVLFSPSFSRKTDCTRWRMRHVDR